MKKEYPRRKFVKELSLAASSMAISNPIWGNASTKNNGIPLEINTPDWVKNAVFYQIFPERFGKSERTLHPPEIQFAPWGSDASLREFQGGDLYAVIEKLDYLKELGINAIYLNPIFKAPSPHRYNTYDYFQVDPILGGNKAFKELLDKAHERDIKIVLDGVFNHCGRGFWQFNHILELENRSPYLGWFKIKGFPLRAFSFSDDNPAQYMYWQRFPLLPEFNTDHPGARAFLFKVAKHWIDFGIDGWRLDVATDIEDDSFWQEFRTLIKAANPEAYIVGEHWQEATHWLGGDMFDGVMNYIFSSTAMGFFGARTLKNYNYSHWPFQTYDAPGFKNKIENNLKLYDWEITQTMLNILGTHDTPRAIEILGYDRTALKLCALFQMTMPGAPCVYYGDEIGLKGHRREAFPYDDSKKWDAQLLGFYKGIIGLRNTYVSLRTGKYTTVYARGEVFAFERKTDSETAIVAFNASMASASCRIDRNAKDFEQVWPEIGSKRFKARGKQILLSLPRRDAVVLIKKE